DFSELRTDRLCDIKSEGNEEIELFLLTVKPEVRVAYGGSCSDESRVFVVALVGDADAPVQGPDTDPVLTLKGVIALIGVLHRWRTVLGRLVQTLEAFLGDLGSTMF